MFRGGAYEPGVEARSGKRDNINRYELAQATPLVVIDEGPIATIAITIPPSAPGIEDTMMPSSKPLYSETNWGFQSAGRGKLKISAMSAEHAALSHSVSIYNSSYSKF